MRKKYMSKPEYWFIKIMYHLFFWVFAFIFTGKELSEMNRMLRGGFKKIQISDDDDVDVEK